MPSFLPLCKAEAGAFFYTGGKISRLCSVLHESAR